MTLPNFKQLSLGAPPGGHGGKQRGRAFLFVVADGYPDKGINEPVLLLLSHKHNHGAFGVPGGLQDPSDIQKRNPDAALQVTAMREFVEEFLAFEKKTHGISKQKAAATIMVGLSNFPLSGTVHTGHNTKADMGSFVLRVPSALAFERAASLLNPNIKPDASRQQKRNTPISNEMAGYAWVSKSAIAYAVNNNVLDSYGQLQVKDTQGVTLAVRDYSLGSTHGGQRFHSNTLTKTMFL